MEGVIRRRSLQMRILTSKAMKIYEVVAFSTFNVIVLIILVNLVLAGLFLVRDLFSEKYPSVDRKVGWDREHSADLQAYTRLSSSEANAFLDEQDAFMSIGMLYEPWIEFRYPEFHGQWLNTDSQGFRWTKPPRSSDTTPLKVFVFGGSTTFGSGVPDQHTIPTYMQTILEDRYPQRSIVVSNYGQGFYYSSQELQLFLSLLKKQIIPDYAVFIDGLNDGIRGGRKGLGYDEHELAPHTRRLWDAKRGAPSRHDKADGIVTPDESFVAQLKNLPTSIPMVRLANSLRARWLSYWESDLAAENGPHHQEALSLKRGPDAEHTSKSIVSIYTANVGILQAICREYGVKCYFIWQPVPFYKYDRKLVRNFPIQANGPYWANVYSSMEAVHLENFLFLGAMLETVTEKVFVDQLHYNERISEEIARRICDFLRLDHRTSLKKREMKGS